MLIAGDVVIVFTYISIAIGEAVQRGGFRLIAMQLYDVI
jgi:hypothetical protein